MESLPISLGFDLFGSVSLLCDLKMVSFSDLIFLKIRPFCNTAIRFSTFNEYCMGCNKCF
jgi:hypothetical protein